jgi:hypothetical protein
MVGLLKTDPPGSRKPERREPAQNLFVSIRPHRLKYSQATAYNLIAVYERFGCESFQLLETLPLALTLRPRDTVPSCGGPCVQVTACGGRRGPAKGLLHERDGRASVEAMARVGMAQKGTPRITHENGSYRDLFRGAPGEAVSRPGGRVMS